MTAPEVKRRRRGQQSGSRFEDDAYTVHPAMTLEEYRRREARRTADEATKKEGDK